MPNTGQTDQVLITGRIAYGFDGINARPIKVDSNGYLIGSTPTKTIQTELLAITAVAASTQAKSSTLALTGIKKATVFIDHGRGAAGSPGTNGTEYRVEVSEKASGNDTWSTIDTETAGTTSALAVASSGAVAGGASTIVILSGTTLALGDNVFWANTASAGSCEWGTVVAISGTASFTLLDPITNAQAAAHTIYTQAEQFVMAVDVEAMTRMRVVVNNNASGTTLAVYSRVACITES